MAELSRWTVGDNKELDSRYRKLERVRYEDYSEIIETQNDVEIPKSDYDKIHIVKAGEEGRLDMISAQYYGSSLYWWAIAYASNIYDPFSIRPGDKLRIPSLPTILGLKGVMIE